jgi:hypothetical protein
MLTRYETEWKSSTLVTSKKKVKTYSTIKNKFVLKNNVISTSLDKQKEFTKLRISAHKLHVESGRYNKPNIPHELRIMPILW